MTQPIRCRLLTSLLLTSCLVFSTSCDTSSNSTSAVVPEDTGDVQCEEFCKFVTEDLLQVSVYYAGRQIGDPTYHTLADPPAVCDPLLSDSSDELEEENEEALEEVDETEDSE